MFCTLFKWIVRNNFQYFAQQKKKFWFKANVLSGNTQNLKINYQKYDL